jgi:predicted MPP superfamily phosphohydrolase
MKPLWKATAAGGAALLGVLGYAAFVEPYWIDTVHIEIGAPRLPAAFDGYTIYQISDLHLQTIGRRERTIISILESLPPADLVVLTGDLVHTRRGIDPLLEIVRSIKARDGIYAVFGNSEYKNGVRARELAGRLHESCVRVLLNQPVILPKNGDEIVLAGVEDAHTGVDDLDLALTGVPDDVFKLVLMHSPDGIAEAVVRGVDLVLSGHTHGGQINLPLVGAPITHSIMGMRMSSGYYQGYRLRTVVGIRPGRTQLYISRGLGVSGFALRFNCRPEFTAITLRRGIPACRRRPFPIQ